MNQNIAGDKNTPVWWQADDKVEAYLLAKHEEMLRELADEWYGQPQQGETE
jgi:hypothetical protein